MNHLDCCQTWFIIGFALTAIFYPLESVWSHFTVFFGSTDHELEESLLQQGTITSLHCWCYTAWLLTMMLWQIDCIRKQCTYVIHFSLCSNTHLPGRVSELKDRMLAEAGNVHVFVYSRKEILKHNNVRFLNFFTYFTILLHQSNKTLEGTVSTPVRKQMWLWNALWFIMHSGKRWHIPDHVALSASPGGLLC